MLVLALDTATPTVTAGVVALEPAALEPTVGAASVQVRAVRVAVDARKHAELLVPGALAACAEAGITLRDVEAVVVGTGPGPFTGLRVGMVTAAALGDALDVPVYGVCTLDAIAAAHPGTPLLVVTDARRREVYWAAYDGAGARTHGPDVTAPAALAARIPQLAPAAAAGGSAHLFDLPVVGPDAPGPDGLVTVAAAALLAGATPGPLEPLYLRRPDAQEPGARKKVSVG